ncbi:hypothetical protein Tco_0942466 [Tanacetum coccineum]
MVGTTTLITCPNSWVSSIDKIHIPQHASTILCQITLAVIVEASATRPSGCMVGVTSDTLGPSSPTFPLFLTFLIDPFLTIIHNAAFQTDDLYAYDSNYDDISSAKAILMANLSSYSLDVLSKVAQHDTYQIDMLNQSVQETQNFEQSLIDFVPNNEITSDSNIISYEQYLQQTQNTIVQDSNSFAQQDAMIMSVFEQLKIKAFERKIEKKGKFSIDTNLFSRVSKAWGRFQSHHSSLLVYAFGISLSCSYTDVAQRRRLGALLRACRPFISLSKSGGVLGKKKNKEKKKERGRKIKKRREGWLGKRFSNPIFEQPVFQTTPVKTEAPSEIPKVSLVKTSFQKLKNHLASFDKVVKVRTTPDAITEGSWGFEHTKAIFKQEVIPFIKTLRDLFKEFDNGLHIKINEVKMVFNQIEAIVEQCSVDKKYFDIQKKEIFLDNDRLLEHIICQDVMNILMHADYVTVNVLPANNKCLVHDNLKIERLEQENEHLFELLLSQDIVHICVNCLATRNECCEMQQSFIHEYKENLVLKAEIAKKEHMIENKNFDEVVLRCS